MWFMVLSPDWRRHINICQMNVWTWSENVPYQPKGNQLPIQSTAKSFPKCITGCTTLNNPALKYIEGNGVWGRLMENYQPRMKASWVLDLLLLFLFTMQIALLLFLSLLLLVFLVSSLLTYYYFLYIFLLHFFPLNFQYFFLDVTVYFITKMVSRYLKS